MAITFLRVLITSQFSTTQKFPALLNKETFSYPVRFLTHRWPAVMRFPPSIKKLSVVVFESTVGGEKENSGADTDRGFLEQQSRRPCCQLD